MSGRLRVLVADDEALARQRLARLLGEVAGAECVGECRNGAEVLERLRGGGVDVLLLDIRMPKLTGLDAVRAAAPCTLPQVIFCTAHAEHAVDAFDAGVVDYLLKPVDVPKLQRALERAAERLRHRRDGASALERIAIAGTHGIELVDPRTISHAVLEGALVTIATNQGKLFTDASLADLLLRLPAGQFERVHRRALVNLAEVTRLEPSEVGGFYAVLRGGERVEVSRQAARALRRRLGLGRAPGDPDAEE